MLFDSLMQLPNSTFDVPFSACCALNLVDHVGAMTKFWIRYRASTKRTSHGIGGFAIERLSEVPGLAVHDGVETFLLKDSSNFLVKPIADKGHLEEKQAVVVIGTIFPFGWSIAAVNGLLSVAILSEHRIEVLQVRGHLWCIVAFASFSDTLLFIPDNVHLGCPW
jgi:hypothetical protein